MTGTPEPNPSFERSNKLPDEILGAHQTRADFLKWKLLLVAALGAAGLGLGEKSKPVYLLVALIPLVCLYVDLLCMNLKVRVLVIGTFYANSREDAYERYTQKNRKVFETEDWALHYSTYVLCLVVIGVGCLAQTFDAIAPNGLMWLHPLQWTWKWPSKDDAVLIVSGLAGLGLSWFTWKRAEQLLGRLTTQIEAREPKVSTSSASGSQVTSAVTLLRPQYTAQEFNALRSFLTQKGIFIFQSLPNGLFSASGSAGADDVSGYQNVWVRDNVHIAHAHYVCGDKASAARNLAALMKWFQKEEQRFRDVISSPRDKDGKNIMAQDPMKRPNIRFDGRRLENVKAKWPNAQNDALGYFLWLYSKLSRDKVVSPGLDEVNCLALFPRYFEAIQYWLDEDNGHWEEVPKVEASSIGVVVAGLREFEEMLKENPTWTTASQVDPRWLARLRVNGEDALNAILPCETNRPLEEILQESDEAKTLPYRRYDSALLFLIYPLEVLRWDNPKTREVLGDIKTHLQGDFGIRRYLGDSYWFPDYQRVPIEQRTTDYSERMAERDVGARLGQEAQWCIFDPILSVIYGLRYLHHKGKSEQKEAGECLQLQIEHFNRSVSQLAEGNAGLLQAPEAYYVKKGRYVPNDHTPLLWTQANLWLAVNQMQQSMEAKTK